MSGIAKVLHERGESVTGSDRTRSSFSEALEELGIPVHYGHRPEYVEGADLVLASAAVPDDNVELAAAVQHGIPVLRRDDFWGELTVGYETIAIAGTHGKTTTSGLVAWILDQAGYSPSFLIGGEIPDFGTNARSSEGSYFVVEADEYGLAFLGLRPAIGVVTNVEHDHPDQFVSFQAVHSAFQSFVDGISRTVVLCADDPGAVELETSGRERITYALQARANWTADELQANGAGGFDFLVNHDGRTVGLARTRLPGRHNVANALAAIAVCSELGVPFTEVRAGLMSFHGAGRRFELMGEVGEVRVIDDYAHHPTEIRATLQAARTRYPGARIVAVFQPHTYSRTKTFLGALAGSFSAADDVIVTEIFASRETPDEEFSGRDVANAINHPQVSFATTLQEAANRAADRLKGETIVLLLSAGDGNRVGELLLEELSESREGSSNG